MTHHAAFPGMLAGPSGLVGEDKQSYQGLCETLAYYGAQDAQFRMEPSTGFAELEERMRREGLVTTMTQEDARTCYMQGYNEGAYTPKQAAVGGLILGGVGGAILGILGTLAVQRWL